MFAAAEGAGAPSRRRRSSRSCKQNWREIVLTALLRTGQQVPFYIFTTYIITYATQQLGFSRADDSELRHDPMALISTRDRPALRPPVRRLRPPAHHRDRLHGHDRISVRLFRLLDTQSDGAGLPRHHHRDCHCTTCSTVPRPRSSADSFPGSLRYSGSSLGYQLASITAGGPAPIIAVHPATGSSARRWRSRFTWRSAR